MVTPLSASPGSALMRLLTKSLSLSALVVGVGTLWILDRPAGADLGPTRVSAATVPDRSAVPIDRFLPDTRTPDGIRLALQRASDYSSRHGVAVTFGPDTLMSSGDVVLREGTHFVGRGGVIRAAKKPRSSYLFVVGGSNVTIEGLKVDFNGAGSFATGFAIRTGGLRHLMFRGLHFFDSDEPDPSTNYGDRWGILAAPVDGLVAPIEDLQVRDNRAENGVQLTAGYGNRGVRGAWIVGNVVRHAEENAIALVMASGPGGLEDIHILDNTIIGPRGVGIYIGVDENKQAGTFVRDVHVERNRIDGFTHPRRGSFGILFRAAELGNEGIVVRDNVIDGHGNNGSAVGIRLQAKKQVNPNLAPGEARHFAAPVIESNQFHNVSPAIDLWHTRGGIVRDNRGAMPRFIELRSSCEGVRVYGNHHLVD